LINADKIFDKIRRGVMPATNVERKVKTILEVAKHGHTIVDISRVHALASKIATVKKCVLNSQKEEKIVGEWLEAREATRKWNLRK
jgi:hypothetical protein